MREGHDASRARSLRSQRTEAEHRLWQHLRDRRLAGFKFRRQHQIGPFFADFFCAQARLVVEVDGSQHADDAAYDLRRERYLAAAGVRVLRFWNHDVLARTEVVLAVIAVALGRG